jgi:hypothetical protein
MSLTVEKAALNDTRFNISTNKTTKTHSLMQMHAHITVCVHQQTDVKYELVNDKFPANDT